MPQLPGIATLFLSLVLLQGCIGTDIVPDPVVAASLTIQPRIDSLRTGETQQFSVRYFNEFGVAEEVSPVWGSTDTSNIRIDAATGLASGLTGAEATIYATAAGLTDSLRLNSGISNAPDPRTATWTSVGGYDAEGMVTLEQQGDGKLHLVMSSDFRTSAGPSLYLLLANHTNGAYTVTIGGNAVNGNSAQITPTKMTTFTGALDFEVPDGVLIDDYRYAVLYCTLGPLFGIADFEN